jgi:hypothetical protein
LLDGANARLCRSALLGLLDASPMTRALYLDQVAPGTEPPDITPLVTGCGEWWVSHLSRSLLGALLSPPVGQSHLTRLLTLAALFRTPDDDRALRLRVLQVRLLDMLVRQLFLSSTGALRADWERARSTLTPEGGFQEVLAAAPHHLALTKESPVFGAFEKTLFGGPSGRLMVGLGEDEQALIRLLLDPALAQLEERQDAVAGGLDMEPAAVHTLLRRFREEDIPLGAPSTYTEPPAKVLGIWRDYILQPIGSAHAAQAGADNPPPPDPSGDAP